MWHYLDLIDLFINEYDLIVTFLWITLSRSNCDFLWSRSNCEWRTLSRSNCDLFMNWHYLDLIVTFLWTTLCSDLFWTTLSRLIMMTFLWMRLSRSNCDLFMNLDLIVTFIWMTLSRSNCDLCDLFMNETTRSNCDLFIWHHLDLIVTFLWMIHYLRPFMNYCLTNCDLLMNEPSLIVTFMTYLSI